MMIPFLIDSFIGNSNTVKNFTEDKPTMFAISNDGLSNLTVQTSSMDFAHIVKPGVTFGVVQVGKFTQITINATDDFSCSIFN